MNPSNPDESVMTTLSSKIWFLTSEGFAPRALLIPISLVLSFTVINRMFEIAITPARIVNVPTMIVKSCIPDKNPDDPSDKNPARADAAATYASGMGVDYFSSNSWSRRQFTETMQGWISTEGVAARRAHPFSLRDAGGSVGAASPLACTLEL